MHRFATVRTLFFGCFLWSLTSAGSLEAARARDFWQRSDEWFRSEEGRRFATNILSFQSPHGSWPKDTDTVSEPYTDDPQKLQGTFDNAATTDELRFLARSYQATENPKCKTAFVKGFEVILKAQYPTGGWPQLYPVPKSYHRHITFNDDVMLRLMQFLREVATSRRYEFLTVEQREAAKHSFDRGIQCIVKAQVFVDGKLTAWCAQHDAVTLVPQPGRTFEPVSLSGSESARLVQLLMSLENPGDDIIHAVDSAMEWFQKVRLTGIRVEEREDPRTPTGKDRYVVEDPNAGPIWARFYEIGTNRPLYCGRDGVVKYQLSEISHERRNGYGWLGYWPKEIINEQYPLWKRRWQKAVTQ
jgi:pectate lyase